jgi:hypothetical protein
MKCASLQFSLVTKKSCEPNVAINFITVPYRYVMVECQRRYGTESDKSGAYKTYRVRFLVQDNDYISGLQTRFLK